MKIIEDIPNFCPKKPVVLTIGTFDGVHLGHQKIIEQLKEVAQSIGGESYLLTFDPHPRKIIAPNEYKEILIQTLKEKEEKLKEYGLDYLIVYPFTVSFSELSAFDFVKKILIDQLKVDTLVIGYDHHFGAKREGNIHFLKEFSKTFKLNVIEIPAQEIDALKISSTRIRNAIHEGKMKEVQKLLGNFYRMEGEIVKGDQIGRTLGFPTANFKLFESNKIIPSHGVYLVHFFWNKQQFNGVMNIGVRPTLDQKPELRLEIHLLDFNAQLYGEKVKIEIIEKLRDEKKFANLEELKIQISKDVQIAHTFFNANLL